MDETVLRGAAGPSVLQARGGLYYSGASCTLPVVHHGGSLLSNGGGTMGSAVLVGHVLDTCSGGKVVSSPIEEGEEEGRVCTDAGLMYCDGPASSIVHDAGELLVQELR